MAGFRIGANTLYPDGPLKDSAGQFGLEALCRSLDTIRDAGMTGVEFSHFAHLGLGDCEALREACRERLLEPWSAHTWVPIPARRAKLEEALPQLLTSIEKAGRLGARVLVVHSSPHGTEEGAAAERRETMRECLKAVAPAAAESALRIGVENCADRDDLELMADTIHGLELPGIGFNIDTGHAVIRGMTPEEVIRRMGHRLYTTHLQDNFGQRDDHLPPGRGTAICWPGVLEALLEVGYAGTLMVELSDRPPARPPAPVADTHAAAGFLRGLLAGRGVAIVAN